MADDGTVRVFTKLGLPEDHPLRKWEGLDDGTVAMMMQGYCLVEYESGILAPMMQFRPAVTLKLASVLTECADEIIQRYKEGR